MTPIVHQRNSLTALNRVDAAIELLRREAGFLNDSFPSKRLNEFSELVKLFVLARIKS
ncbi:MAG: hypothetical protein R3C49_27345 [Planctomycetaceae bacterium]